MIRRSLCLVAAGVLGCNAPDPPAGTGGTDVLPGECGRGVLVVGTDYQSTNVSLVGLDGAVLSSSFVSSATVDAQLSAKLGGDVVLPTTAQLGPEVVLIDRHPASVLTWVAVQTGKVTRQLSVRTGFAANPRDLLPIDDHKAYVTRFEPNLDAGSEPFDLGDDVLIVDPSAPAIVGRIDLSPARAGAENDLYARPSRGAVLGGRAFVMLEMYSLYFEKSAPSRLVTLDPATDSILGWYEVQGLHGCEGFAPSPDGTRIALSCSGEFGGGSTPSIAQSGLVVLEVGPDEPPRELHRISATELGGAPLGFSLAWTTDQRLLASSFGQLGPSGGAKVPDRVLEIDLSTREQRTVLTSDADAFVLGDLRCAASCRTCFAADAERAVLHRVDVDEAGRAELSAEIVVDESIGLPPRGLGRF